MEIISFLKYTNRLKTPTPIPFQFHSHEKKPNIMSKELTDYIKKSNDLSIENKKQQFTNGKVTFTRKLENVYPKKGDDKNFDEYDLIIHKELNNLINSYKKTNNSFSPELFYEIGKELYKNINYYSYLGLFTGIFIIILRREKVELSNWFSKR